MVVHDHTWASLCLLIRNVDGMAGLLVCPSRITKFVDCQELQNKLASASLQGKAWWPHHQVTMQTNSPYWLHLWWLFREVPQNHLQVREVSSFSDMRMIFSPACLRHYRNSPNPGLFWMIKIWLVVSNISRYVPRGMIQWNHPIISSDSTLSWKITNLYQFVSMIYLFLVSPLQFSIVFLQITMHHHDHAHFFQHKSTCLLVDLMKPLMLANKCHLLWCHRRFSKSNKNADKLRLPSRTDFERSSFKIKKPSPKRIDFREGIVTKMVVKYFLFWSFLGCITREYSDKLQCFLADKMRNQWGYPPIKLGATCRFSLKLTVFPFVLPACVYKWTQKNDSEWYDWII